MVACGGCGNKSFIKTLTPFETQPCGKCGHPIMMPVEMKQFELRAPIASGGMGTVYRAIVPFIILQAIGILICALFPELVLWLPQSMIN